MQNVNLNYKRKILRNIGYKIVNIGSKFIIQQPKKCGCYVTILNTSLQDDFWIEFCINRLFSDYMQRVESNSKGKI